MRRLQNKVCKRQNNSKNESKWPKHQNRQRREGLQPQKCLSLYSDWHDVTNGSTPMWAEGDNMPDSWLQSIKYPSFHNRVSHTLLFWIRVDTLNTVTKFGVKTENKELEWRKSRVVKESVYYKGQQDLHCQVKRVWEQSIQPHHLPRQPLQPSFRVF